MTDNQVRNQNSWDEKYSALLQKLDDYQEEKDNPRKQVVDIEMDELLVGPSLVAPCRSMSHEIRWWIGLTNTADT